MLGLPVGKLHRWYKQILSDFEKAAYKDKMRQQHLREPVPRHQKEGELRVKVPIFEEGNLGPEMAIDEKYICGKYYTILMNRENGKIAMMANTLKANDLEDICSRFGAKRFEVRRLTRDLGQTYGWLGRKVFMNAEQVGDKYHVLVHGFEAINSLRLLLKEQELTAQREAKNAPVTLLENGETAAQLLHRSRHLLYKREHKWNEEQKNRAHALFNNYPQLAVAYVQLNMFRDWYDTKIGTPGSELQRSLDQWYSEVEKHGDEATKNFSALVNRNQGIIMNYFHSGATNAKAEALNACIQRFIINSYGSKNIDFLLFRLRTHFA